MSDPTKFSEVAARLVANGYEPIPIKRGLKHPGFTGWQGFAYIAGCEESFPKHGAGILGKTTPAVDIDVNDPDAVHAITEAIREICGLADGAEIACRTGRAPRVLIPFRCDPPIKKMKSAEFRLQHDQPGDKPSHVEILGDGQQFVAYHIHPETRRPYAWNGCDLLTTPRSALPSLTKDTARRIIAGAEHILCEFGERIDVAGKGAPDADGDGGIIPDGARDDTINSLAGTMRKRGMPTEAIEAALLVVNKAQCKPPLPDRRVREIAAGITRYPAGVVPGDSLVVKRMSDVQAEPLEWLEINGRRNYARGKVTLIGGDPGLGKSAMLTSDEAYLTAEGQGVVVFSAEDDAAETMRPRYDVAGADVSLVIHVQGVQHVREDGSTERHAFNLERDIETLRALLAENPGVVFVRIDPVTAYLGRVDSHKNAEVRALLSRLEEIAREFRVAIVVVTHLNKNSTGPALYRFVGSLAFVAACRLAFVVARDPENPDRRLLVPAKANIAADQMGYAFTINGVMHEGIGQTVAKVGWEPDPIPVTLDKLVQADGAHRRHERERVKDFLKRELAAGPVASKALFQAAEAEGISQRTLFRAKDELRIPAHRQFTEWYWSAPDDWK
jgi:putative DNA primase/helicase